MRFLPQTLAIAAAAILLSSIATPVIAAVKNPWMDEPYTYVGNGESVRRALQIFGQQFGLTVHVSAEVSGHINGEIAEQTPEKFLDRMASMHGLDWYLDNGTLYISTIARRKRRTIKAPASVMSQLRNALEGAGVYETRFGWGELPQQGQLLVSGPPAYVARVEQTIRMIASTPSGFQLALFPLKYANVEDRVMNFRDKQITVPGVASIVRGLAGGVPDSGTPPISNTSDTSNAGSNATSAKNNADWGALQGNAIIESNVRMNALIVKAPPEMLAFYKTLIEQLDVDVPLVQIEVSILDIDSDYLEDIGLKWALGNQGQNQGTSLFDLNPLTATANTILPRGFNLSAQVNLLQRNGRGQVVSKPSLLTMDNTAALFDSSETSYIRTIGERTVETLPVSAGLLFKVTPRVIDSGSLEQRKILLQLDIEDGKRVNSTDQELPVFKKSTINTQAIVGDSESLLIAGHQRQETQETTTKVPLLGSLPFIGALFRNKTETNTQRTRFFIITPRIVRTLRLDNAIALPAFETARGMRAGSDAPAGDESATEATTERSDVPATEASAARSTGHPAQPIRTFEPRIPKLNTLPSQATPAAAGDTQP